MASMSEALYYRRERPRCAYHRHLCPVKFQRVPFCGITRQLRITLSRLIVPITPETFICLITRSDAPFALEFGHGIRQNARSPATITRRFWLRCAILTRKIFDFTARYAFRKGFSGQNWLPGRTNLPSPDSLT